MPGDRRLSAAWEQSSPHRQTPGKIRCQALRPGLRAWPVPISLRGMERSADYTTKNMTSKTIELLRFTTAGSVDDGKSTLIGKLLYDSKSLFEDQVRQVQAASIRKGRKDVDLAMFTDGLKDERTQGITIDVAYRYFSTPKRKFIIADTPGHIQYTPNMVTGASTANLALILIDARNGVVDQTKRHSVIASLLQIPHIVVCINKMDLVGYCESRFEEIKNEFMEFATKLDIQDVRVVPISALKGSNVVKRGNDMEWFHGPPLLETLENIYISSDKNHIDGRLPIQTVIRVDSEEFPDFRGYCGRVSGGIFRPGDLVRILPSGFQTRISFIRQGNKTLQEAFPPMSVTVGLEEKYDISRGDLLVRPGNQPSMDQDLEVMICWFDRSPPRMNRPYTLRHTTTEMKCMMKEIRYRVDINTLRSLKGDTKVGMNDIFRAGIRASKPIMTDPYRRNRETGSLILVDPSTNATIGAGMIC